jgi:circadian clock protein KaiC
MRDETRRVVIERLATGVPGLDQVLGGGLPEYSFNLIAGSPGSGKTTLAHQIMFEIATPERPAVYFTVLGEPPIKMLRYQQQMSFFNPTKVGEVIRFVSLSEEVLHLDLEKVLERIVREVEETNPSVVVVDSFRTVIRATSAVGTAESSLQGFVQRLALHLTTWQVTSFLVGEYSEGEMANNPVFTVADGIFWLFQSIERNSIVRKLQVVKQRGQAPMPGLHTFRITNDGLQVFPRIPQQSLAPRRARPSSRARTGIAELDEMLNGGFPAGDSVLITGPSGAGKTILATQFIAEGVAQGEPAVIAVFEEHPQEYLDRAKGLGFDLEAMIAAGQLRVMYLRPLDLSVDETLQGIREAAEEIGAKRVVIDSISGFELALAPTFRDDFRESLYRLVRSLTNRDITVLMTVEIVQSFDQLSFSQHEISFLADDVILQRYVELGGQLRKVITVVKMRGSDHSKDFREYAITDHGLAVGMLLDQYQGIIRGVLEGPGSRSRATYPGLSEDEARVLERLNDLGEGSVASLAPETHLSRPELTRALRRLFDLSYVTRAGTAGQTVYRPVNRAE